MTFTPDRVRHRLRVLLAGLVCVVACQARDRAAEAPADRPWPGYQSWSVSGRSADTVHIRYGVDSSGAVDSTSFVFVRPTTDVLTSTVTSSVQRTRFRAARKAGRPSASTVEERFVFEYDSAAPPESLTVARDSTGSIPTHVLGSKAPSRTISVAWSDVREAYRPVLTQLLETHTLRDSLAGRVATICLGTPSANGRNERDTAAAALLRRHGRDVVPIDDCPSYLGNTRDDAPPPTFKPRPGDPAPVYIVPYLESWTVGAVWIRAHVVQHHGVDVHMCEARRRAAAWSASCSQIASFIF